MIWKPKKGLRVRLWYKKSMARAVRHHDRVGEVVCAGAGPGPINALVKRYGGELVVVPRGNLHTRGCGPCRSCEWDPICPHGWQRRHAEEIGAAYEAAREAAKERERKELADGWTNEIEQFREKAAGEPTS